jgi:CRP-like cAMP-binding protein
MKTVRVTCKTLEVPAELAHALQTIGQAEHLRAAWTLFRAGDANAGVFLVYRGKIRLSVPGLPKLDRVFGKPSLLGLPSTFTGEPYKLDGVAVSNSDVIHVQRQSFLDLMSTDTALCGEAMVLLSREEAFILSALRKRRSLA